MLAPRADSGPRWSTLQDRLVATGGRSSGFDYLRVFLATAIIVWHSFAVSYGMDFTTRAITWWNRPAIGMILPMFFALSGFLVAGSLERSRGLITFLGLRVLRIVPALGVEVGLSALILGPILTSFSLNEYFSSPLLPTYALNIIGDIHYKLPGLFVSNPIPGVVNLQLWTIPYELKCYLAIAVLSLVGITKKPILLFIATISGCLAYPILHYFIRATGDVDSIVVTGNVLVLAFLAGISLHAYRAIIPWNIWLCAACGGALIVILMVRSLDFLTPLPAAYVTVYLGLTDPRRTFVLRGGDYSYGLFLYGFVIQQAMACFGAWAQVWYVNLALTLPVAVVVAGISWHIVERPALALRRHLPKLEDAFDAKLRRPLAR